MLTEFIPGERKYGVHCEVVFDDGHNNGFGFPCTEAGELLPDLSEDAKRNYQFCMENPQKFVRFNKVVRQNFSYRENNRGQCECGNRFELIGFHAGACQCDKCGRWYNIFGQELLPPDQWEE